MSLDVTDEKALLVKLVSWYTGSSQLHLQVFGKYFLLFYLVLGR